MFIPSLRRFEQVLHLPGHKGPVWALDVSRDGSFAISGGQDRSLRVWERGEDLVFVEEERERALEALAEKAAGDDSNTNGPTPEGVLSTGDTELTAARKSLESVRSGELLMDAVDLVEAELADQEQYAAKLASGTHTRLAKRVPNVQLLGLEPLAHLMRCLRLIKQPELEQSLLVLPFHYVTRLLKLLIEMSQQSRYDVELCCRCSVFLLRCHFQQIVAARAFIQEIQDLQTAVRFNITSLRTLVGTNLAGLRHMKRAHDEDNLKYLSGAADMPEVPTVLEAQQAKSRQGSKAKKRKVK
jgi:U3 small nucleolar RNA-associated protein 12